MELMKVADYSKAFKVSVQAVYQRIKSGHLEVEIKDGVKYVKVENKEILNNINNDEQVIKQEPCKEIIKPYKMMIKDLRKQIKRLEQDKDRSYSNLEKLFNKALEIKRDIPMIEAKVIEKKRKKNKKKKEVKQIIATEKIFNAYGDLIAIRYYYADGLTREIKRFIPRHLIDSQKSL